MNQCVQVINVIVVVKINSYLENVEMGNKTKMYVDIMALHQEVTGSCFLCVVKLPDKTTTRFIVDCGVFQEEEYSKYNWGFPFDPDKISFVLATHNHVDHIRFWLMFAKGCINSNFML
jgi:Cft2 family RNA processing exonuclease